MFARGGSVKWSNLGLARAELGGGEYGGVARIAEREDDDVM